MDEFDEVTYTVTWFPYNAPQLTRSFRSLTKADKFANEILEFNPIVEQVTTIRESFIIYNYGEKNWGK